MPSSSALSAWKPSRSGSTCSGRSSASMERRSRSIITYGLEVGRKLDALVHSAERTEELAAEIERVRTEAVEHARKLSDLRRKGGKDFATRIVKELESLSMPSAAFEVSQERGGSTRQAWTGSSS